jgi:hypothetical protein
MRSTSLSSVGSTTGNSTLGGERLWGMDIALAGEAESSGPTIAALAGVGEAGSGAGADDNGANSRMGLSRRALALPDCIALKQSVLRASMCARMPPD